VIHSARFINPSHLVSDSPDKAWELCDHIVGQYASNPAVGHAGSGASGSASGCAFR
jgi:hypothetical protein